MENHFGKTSQVRIATKLKNERAVLEDVYFTAPFKIMRPFYKTPDSLQVMMMTASSGVMEGDVQDFSFHIGSGTSLEFCSQSFEKIHKMKDGEAVRHTAIKVDEDACFYFNPLPSIPFKDSAFRNTMEVHLTSSTSRFIMSEILSCGRSACGECFDYRYYHSFIQVYQAGELIYRDNTHYDPLLFEMKGICMYEGYTHLANLLIYNMEKDNQWLESVRELIESKEQMTGGITRLASGDYMIKILGYQAQKLSDICREIIER